MKRRNLELIEYRPAELPQEQKPQEYTPLSPLLQVALKELQREITSAKMQGEIDGPIREFAFGAIDRVAARLGLELTHLERDELLQHLESFERPFGIIQALVDDPAVSDIIISSFSCITVQQGRRNHRTQLSFSNQEMYEAFVERLLQYAGATYSTKQPIADGMIGSFARIHAVHRSLCDGGPYVTIRINRFSRVGIEDLVHNGLAPQQVMSYLRSIIRLGHTVLIVGEVGTGKTTLARALAASIPANESILVIEDTPEIQLEHPHVRYLRTRDENTEGVGRVSPSQCIRAGMRMAMNRIIFGEMRDAEAAESFIDVCASGHPGLSTIHARSAQDAIARLELFLGRAQKGVERRVLAEQIVTAVQVIVHVNICPITKRRRVIEVREIGPVADGVVRQREIFRYQITDGLPAWRVVNKASNYRSELEHDAEGILLHQLPSVLELHENVLLREVGSR